MDNIGIGGRTLEYRCTSGRVRMAAQAVPDLKLILECWIAIGTCASFPVPTCNALFHTCCKIYKKS